MSVMLLAQTQDVIGHNKIDPNTEEPHKPPGHDHKPSVRVDSDTGAPVTTGGVDPRGKHFSGTCGKTEEGAQSGWGFRYYGGKYSPSSSGPDCDTQNVYSVSITADDSTGKRHARVSVTPGINQLRQFPDEEDNWQGSATGTVTFSEVNFHGGFLCIRYGRLGDTRTDTGFIDLAIKTQEISEGEKKVYGTGFESHGAKLTANSEHSYTASSDELHARGYRFLVEFKGGLFYTRIKLHKAAGSYWIVRSNPIPP